MSNSNGCKVVLLLLVAVIIGALGFAAGFATRSVLIAADTVTGPAVSQATLPPPEPTAIPATPAPGEPTPVPAKLTPTPSPGGADGINQALFDEVWQIMREEYYGDLPNGDDLTYGAIRGATNTLDDPFTAFIEPKTAAILREDMSGSFEGIGALVTMRDDVLEIVSTFEGQPAAKAGLRGGEIVLKVDDTPIQNMSLYEAIGLIRGPAGSTVRLTIQRAGEEPQEIAIVRATIDIPLVESEMRADGIGYASLYQFDPNASDKLADAVEALLKQNPKGLILDLRNNPGGLVQESILVPGLFLPRDTLVMIERMKDGEETRYQTPYDPIAPDIPLVVLVDEGSASASEIVAGALQDQGRAVLIGAKTFGKGSVQYVHELSDGSELRVTVARWFTPNDRAIHGQGLEPDITVEMTAEDVEAGRDPQLDRAVEYLLTGK